MKIESNKTFECYESAYESWINNGKDITLDGVKLIPITTLDKIRAEITKSKYNHRGEYNRELAFNICLQIIDKYREDIKDADSN